MKTKNRIEETVTRSEAGRRYFKVCNRTLKNWEDKGLLTPIRINPRVVRYSLDQIQRILAQAGAPQAQ